MKITAREIPLEFSNTDLLSYFKSSMNLHLKSNIMYPRGQGNGQFSNCYNGDRLFNVEGPVNPSILMKHGQSTICEKCKQMGHKHQHKLPNI